MINRILKGFAASMLGLTVVISSGNVVKAATSDQVTLSVSKPGAGYVTTSTDPLRVRSQPSTSSTELAYLPSGSKIMIVERTNTNFWKVQYDTDGNYGYVSTQYVTEYDLDYYRTVTLTSGNLRLRAGQGTEYQELAKIPNGRSVPDLLVIGTWDYVLYGNVDGYVSVAYTTLHHY